MFFGAICLYVVIGALVFVLLLDDLARKRKNPNPLCAVFCYTMALMWPLTMVIFACHLIFIGVWKWVEKKGEYNS